MTDKVQKIREEVEIVVNRRLNLLNGDYFDLNEETNGFTNEIMDIINSLQKEPAPKVFEDMLNAKTAAESLGISPEEHDKIVDECLYGKEPELVDVDNLPVTSVWHDANTLPTNYEIKDILVVYNQYGREYLHLYWEDGVYSDAQELYKYNWKYVEKWAYIEDLLKLDNSCYLKKNLQKEPVSEELEEAAKKYADIRISNYETAFYAFMSGAKWQNEQNKQWLADNHKKIFNNGFEEGFEAGRDDMEEQLKKDAIYGEWFRCGIVLPSEYYADDIKKVKLIFVKED